MWHMPPKPQDPHIVFSLLMFGEKAGLGPPMLVLGGSMPAEELKAFMEVSCVEAAAAWKEMAVTPIDDQVRAHNRLLKRQWHSPSPACEYLAY